MAVVSVNEISPGRDGVGSAHQPNQGYLRRRWRIKTDDPYDNPATIQNDAVYQSSGIPLAFGTVHPSNFYFSCRQLTINPEEDSATLWIADANYSNEPLSREEQERASTPNPLNRLPRFSVIGQEYERYSDKDAEGEAFLNSAGVPYPPQIIEHSRPIIRITKNVVGWTTFWFNFVNPLSRNDKPVTVNDGYSSITIGESHGLMKKLELGALRIENGVNYYPLSCEVHIDAIDSWKIELKDQGFVWLSGDGEWVRIKVKDSDEDGGVTNDLIDAPEEQLLNGSGKPLRKPDGSFWDANVTVAQYNEFQRAVSRDWTALPFFT